jgi:hypothetical protein
LILNNTRGFYQYFINLLNPLEDKLHQISCRLSYTTILLSVAAARKQLVISVLRTLLYGAIIPKVGIGG